MNTWIFRVIRLIEQIGEKVRVFRSVEPKEKKVKVVRSVELTVRKSLRHPISRTM